MPKKRDMKIPRREFIKATSMAVAGLSVGGLKAGQIEPVTVNGLPGTVLGRTGLRVTSISFGGIMITEPRVMDRAIDQGINLVHLAPGYHDHRSLEAFGRVFNPDYS